MTLAALAVCGCTAMKPPEKLYGVDEETAELKAALPDPWTAMAALEKLPGREARRQRNNLVTARKYAIDIQYTRYEAQLTHDAQMVDFAARTAATVLGTTADLTPVPHTARLLNGIGTASIVTSDSYNDKILRGKIIESVQASMRTARHERAAVIYANMRCSLKTYPLAMALSDLEAYYRAGTFPAGLIKLSSTVTKAEEHAAATADAQKSGNADAQAKLEGIAEEAGLKAQAAAAAARQTVTTTTVDASGNKKTHTHAHRCSPKDDAD